MNTLPQHGRITCTKCYSTNVVEFDRTTRTGDGWRITANPLAWGNQKAKIVVLGFSKGPTQAGALASTPHDAIAYKGGRANVGKILNFVGLLPHDDKVSLSQAVDRAIADRTGRFHFGSLIRCTVERLDKGSNVWKGSGGGMLDKFVATGFGREVAGNCTTQFLSGLPSETKLVIMFGLGSERNYVRESFALLETARGGSWSWINDIAYTDGQITVVHVEHFASQGALIPNWMGADGHARGKYGTMATDAVSAAMNSNGNSCNPLTQVNN